MGRALLMCLLVLSASDDPVEELAGRVRADPRDGAAWAALARHEEPGQALRTVRVLLLSPATAPAVGANDGLLTLGELLELRIGARLVILSACRTGRGDSFAGEGAGGIARCLLAAGAQNLILSLAPVADAKAPLFMGHLAQSLAAGDAPATALAAAQRHMLAVRSNAHPAFWATFVLHGQADLLR